MTRRISLAILLTIVSSAITMLLIASLAAAACDPPPPGLRVAFIADQGLGSPSVAVLELIADRGADAVLHQGDLDYANDPAAWEDQLDDALGHNFPYFVVAGNHDESAWDDPNGYGERVADRLDRLGIDYEGEAGVEAHISWAGLDMVFVSPDIFDAGAGTAPAYLTTHLGHGDCLWRIASWHKNQHRMQAGGKSNSTGWAVYENARRAGAIIATGHEHSYSRTHLLANMETQAIAALVPPGSQMPLILTPNDPTTPADEGRSFAFVSGLGGESIRDQTTFGPWFASVYTSTQDAAPGALFCDFHHNGDPKLAYCFFEAINGDVPDEFYMLSQVQPGTTACGLLGIEPVVVCAIALWRRRR